MRLVLSSVPTAAGASGKESMVVPLPSARPEDSRAHPHQSTEPEPMFVPGERGAIPLLAFALGILFRALVVGAVIAATVLLLSLEQCIYAGRCL